MCKAWSALLWEEMLSAWCVESVARLRDSSAVMAGQTVGYRRAAGGWLTFQSAFGFSDAQVAGLLEGGEGFVDAADGDFVGVDVEIADCMVDQLSVAVSTLFVY